MAQIDLKEIQRKAYTSYHQDGLIDIFASIYIVGFSIGILLDYLYNFDMATILPILLVPVILPLWIAAKQKITIPRLGYVNFGKRDKPKFAAILGGVAGFGFAVLFIFLFSFRTSPLLDLAAQNSMLLLGVTVALVLALAGYAMGIKRFYAYGALTFALLAVGQYLGIFFAYVLLAISLTIMASGFALLSHFIKKYPKKGD